jgi:hypothetical protein
MLKRMQDVEKENYDGENEENFNLRKKSIKKGDTELKN